MQVGEGEGIEGKIFLVTGGLGFVGSALCLELARRGAREVRAFDLRLTSPFQSKLLAHQIICLQGDISRRDDVEEALCGVDCVFHLASYGMSGKEMMQYGRIDDVNINGTSLILDSCVEFGVQRLIYASTYNVVFGGQEIRNGNEALPYFPVDDHVDPYGRSKSIAERLVLKYNGRRLKGNSGKFLYTTAVRPAAIYGPGEERHFPRIVCLAKWGLLLFKIGDDSVLTDWVFVDNLVHGLLLASVGMLDDLPGRDDPIAAGQAYFISDGSPVSTYEFLRPLLVSLGYDMPNWSISVAKALVLSKIIWLGYILVYPWLSRGWVPQPMILPAEVYKVGVTHYFSIGKAKMELNYAPKVSPSEGMAATIAHWQKRKRKCVDGPPLYIWVFCVVGMAALICAAYAGEIWPVKVACVIACALHVGEAAYAWFLARRVDPGNAAPWFWQTLALGYFSLAYLLPRAHPQSRPHASSPSSS